ncbi:hypothetical protein pdul_cds_191 [Pandoravirus dulcis]|uniref:Uncharacterized protein n=1 Tax=Pandoravirus dulcis TaxID=1349409 RepID=S4VPC8_9VIRU|nr:hypothetical protein pdul_cds_191 [Pandoravirus dulcis]AGO82122.2 hypothetical protein pdul_cds_191 [Pandoravirus dulcis]
MLCVAARPRPIGCSDSFSFFSDPFVVVALGQRRRGKLPRPAAPVAGQHKPPPRRGRARQQEGRATEAPKPREKKEGPEKERSTPTQRGTSAERDTETQRKRAYYIFFSTTMATAQTTGGPTASRTRARARRARQRASRWRQRVVASTAGTASTTGTAPTAGRATTGAKRPACHIEDADPDAPFDEGFTVDALSMDREAFAAAVPPERRLVVTVAAGGTRVAFDVVDVYRWLRANPDGGICGPFGQVPIDQRQRDEITARAERILPKRQRVTQEPRFDYAWHDSGADLHYHEPPSSAYLRECVAIGDHEGVLYCLDALAPGDVHPAQEARSLLVSAANANLTTIFERLVAHEHVGGLLDVAGLASLVGEIGHMRTPRLDLLVPACRALVRAVAVHDAQPTPRRHDRDVRESGGGGGDDTDAADNHGGDENDSADPLDDTRPQRHARALDTLTRTARDIYRSLCLRVAQDDSDSDDDDSSSSSSSDDDSSSDDEGERGRTLPPSDAGFIPNPCCSAAVRAVYEATRVEPDLACLATAVDAGTRDLLDYMLGVAPSLSSVQIVVLARHVIAAGCVRGLRLVMHHHARALDRTDMDAIAEAAAATGAPIADLMGAVVVVWRRRVAERVVRVPPTCPRRMRFED